MKRRLPLFLALLLILACQVVPTPPPLKSTPRGRATSTLPVHPTPSPSPASPAVITPVPATSAPSDLPPFPYPSGQPFADLQPVDWRLGALAASADLPLPASLEGVSNLDVAAGLTSRQRTLLSEQGFVVIHSQEAQFAEIRQRVALRYGQPYYLTTDAAYHALDLSLAELLSALEQEEMHRRMVAVVQATLTETLSYLPLVQGGSLEPDVRLAAAYLGVALRLLDPQAALDPAIASPAQAQVEQVLAARGVEESALLPGFIDDFAAYRPPGRYAGDPHLEAYYRGMTWLGRVTFPIDGRYFGDQPSRAPLVITLALRRAPLAGVADFASSAPTLPVSAAQEWALIQETLTFLVGPSVDYGPPEYAAWMDQVYGRGVTVVSLADSGNWQVFREFARQMSPVAIDPQVSRSLGLSQPLGSWRFIGQRLRLDDRVLQNLIFDRVGTPDAPRLFPSGLDWMAVLGSAPARQALEDAGETAYANYTGRLSSLQELVLRQYQSQWNTTAFDALHYAFLPGLALKDAAYPSCMRSPAWPYKDMNSALGSWVESRSDEFRLDLDVHAPGVATTPASPSPVSGPPPAYVEPDPQVFYRLSYLASAVAEGLNRRGLSGVFSGSASTSALNGLLLEMLDLGDRLRRLGDIAAAELQGQSPDASQRALILAPLGVAEKRLQDSLPSAAQILLPPIQAIVAIPGSDGRALQTGLGAVDRIYALIPYEGEWLVAQGGVYSYYEFPQLSSGPLDSAEWRRLLLEEPPAPPPWTANLYLPEGNPLDVLAFRLGDIYTITPAAGALNMRASPDRFTKVVRQLRPGDYVMLIDGPVQAGGLTWWKLRVDWQAGQPVEGWAPQDPAWYERAWRE